MWRLIEPGAPGSYGRYAASRPTSPGPHAVACHAISGGEGKKIGPDLLGVTQRRSEDWLNRFLKSPEQMFAADPTAKALLDKYKVPMPNQNLSDEEIRGYIKYFRFLDSAQKEPARAAAKK